VNRPVAFSLGSNLGDRLEYLQGATALLAATPGVVLTAVSGVYETDPVGGVEQPDYLNIVVLAESELAGAALLARAQAIENGFGRVRASRWGPRVIDVDLLAVGDEVSHDEALTLPHPRAHERAFVLLPWLDADPDAVLVGHGRVADLLAAIGTAGVRPRPDLVVAR
jgi:2-amino-4-hydroxy-6-hydroxymethyldihydropteridine diphosphokinase